jgi:hypothetical protein
MTIAVPILNLRTIYRGTLIRISSLKYLIVVERVKTIRTVRSGYISSCELRQMQTVVVGFVGNRKCIHIRYFRKY